MPRVTLKQIAERAGVAHTTVSRVLSGKWQENVKPETRARILELADEMGYRPHLGARLMVTGRSYLVGYVTTNLSDHSEKMLEVARRELQSRGLRLSVHVGSLDELVRELGASHVDGAILLDFPEGASSVVRRAFPGVPLVGMGNYHSQDFDYVGVALGQATSDAVQHLVRQGCQRLVHLTDQEDPTSGDVRLNSFINAVRNAGLMPRWERLEEESLQGGMALCQRLFSEAPPPDGLFCRNDVVATAAIRAAHEAGLRVPDDVAIVGCDDIDVAPYLVPSLSTLAQPFEEAVRMATDFVVRRIETPELPQQATKLDAVLVARESSQRIQPIP
jgi:DNA-binding LacI/PurR family transcriptional regulator